MATVTHDDVSVQTPDGYVPRMAFACFGIYVALMAPVYGGLSVKIQSMVGLDAAPVLLGILTGSGAFFSSVVQPIAGRLSDRSTSRFGMRRPFIFCGTMGMFVGLLACGLAPNYPVLLVSWCVVQLSVNFALAALHTTLADQVPQEKRGGVSGIIGAATPGGILGGALLLAVLPTDFLRFAVPATIGLVAISLFVAKLKDRVREVPPGSPLDLKQIFGAFAFSPRANPDFAWAWLSKALILLGYGAVATYLTLFLGDAFGMDPDEQLTTNAIAMVIGVGTLVLFSVVGGFVSDRSGRRKPFVLVAGLVLALGVLLLAASPLFGDAGLVVFMIAQAIIGMGAGTFFAVDQALCIDVLPNEDEMAKDLGILNLAGTLPGAVAPLLAGVVFIPLGNALFGGGYTLWFVVAAVLAVIGSFLVLKIKGSS